MATMGTTAATAWVPPGTRQRMTDVLEQEKRRRRILSSADEWQCHGLSRSAAADVRVRWRREVCRLREGGELLDTVDVLATHGIKAELGARGWDGVWPEVPEEARSLGGRWPGSRDGGYPESIPLRLPSELADRVLAACWHTSAESIRGLRDWRDEHPDIEVPRQVPGRPGEWTGPLAEYERLAASVTTVGEIYRAGLRRGLRHASDLTAGIAD